MEHQMAVGEYALLTAPQLGPEWTLNTELNSGVKPEADLAPREGRAVYMKGILAPTTPLFPSNPSARSLFLFVVNQLFSHPPSFFKLFPAWPQILYENEMSNRITE